tara:strand:- start:186 stop:326 length:141 start_codon:yes stop_codon:yes gene_type:complete
LKADILYLREIMALVGEDRRKLHLLVVLYLVVPLLEYMSQGVKKIL